MEGLICGKTLMLRCNSIRYASDLRFRRNQLGFVKNQLRCDLSSGFERGQSLEQVMNWGAVPKSQAVEPVERNSVSNSGGGVAVVEAEYKSLEQVLNSEAVEPVERNSVSKLGGGVAVVEAISNPEYKSLEQVLNSSRIEPPQAAVETIAKKRKKKKKKKKELDIGDWGAMAIVVCTAMALLRTCGRYPEPKPENSALVETMWSEGRVMCGCHYRGRCSPCDYMRSDGFLALFLCLVIPVVVTVVYENTSIIEHAMEAVSKLKQKHKATPNQNKPVSTEE